MWPKVYFQALKVYWSHKHFALALEGCLFPSVQNSPFTFIYFGVMDHWGWVSWLLYSSSFQDCISKSRKAWFSWLSQLETHLASEWSIVSYTATIKFLHEDFYKVIGYFCLVLFFFLIFWGSNSTFTFVAFISIIASKCCSWYATIC